MLVGENGILTHSETSKQQYELASAREELEMVIADIQTEILKTEGRKATLVDLENRIDKNKYSIILSTDPIATTTAVSTNYTYASVVLLEKEIEFTVDAKLIIRDIKLLSEQEDIKIAEDGAIICDSIMQEIKKYNFKDGNYTFRVTISENGIEEKIDYPIELINYYENIHYTLGEEESKIVSLGDATTEYKMLVVKYHKNLIIDEGVTLTPNTVSELTYKKGMFIYVEGNLENNGKISMSSRGTYNCVGENVYLWKNKNENYEYVPKDGATAGSSVTYKWTSSSSNDYAVSGNAGANGQNRQTGGGGSGALTCRRYDYSSGNRTSGSGAIGTSYSGGSGGGGIDTNYTGELSAENAEQNGGKGGNAYSYRGNTSWWHRYAGGGAGNLGGIGKDTKSNQKLGSEETSFSGQNGTGGLLIIYSNNFNNNGTIMANGSMGGAATASGGSSGGGSINIFANKIENRGTLEALGGNAATGGSYGVTGGAGGNGAVTIGTIKDGVFEEM